MEARLPEVPSGSDLVASGATFGFGRAASPFGNALIAWTDQGLCHLSFDPTEDPRALPARLLADWPGAAWRAEPEAARGWIHRIFGPRPETAGMPLVPRGTPFQYRVWRELLRTRPGTTLSYRELASRIGAPRSARAVGGAVAANRIGFLIPCHRVIRSDGQLGNFAWGPECKRSMLEWEQAARPPS